MIKVNPIRAIALATALTASTAVIAQQNNRLQERQRQFLTEEFRKADTNPQDFFVSQDELNTYMGNPDTKVSDFDSTKDGLLNIDEFSSIVTGKKVTQQTQPASQAQTTQQNTQTQWHAPYVVQQNQVQRTINVQAQTRSVARTQNGREIYNELTRLIEHPEPKTVPGLLWGTRTIYPIDKDKVLATYKKVNENNLKDFLQNVGPDKARDDAHRFVGMYRYVHKVYHNDKDFRLMYAINSPVRQHMISILQGLAKKHGNNIASYLEELRNPTHYGAMDDSIVDAFNAAISNY